MTTTLPRYGVQGSEGLIADAIIQGEAAAARLRQDETLRTAAEQLLKHAQRLDCFDLVAATRAAEPLVTAAVLLSDGTLRMHCPETAAVERLLVVDAATITGNESRNCARRLRARGCVWLALAVYERVRPRSDELGSDPLFDDLVAI